MKQPDAVFFSRYDGKTKSVKKYIALVLSQNQLDENDYPLLQLVIFRHDVPNMLHALNGLDWGETLEMIRDVPHEEDRKQQSFFWEELHVQELLERNDRLVARNVDLHTELEELKAKVATVSSVPAPQQEQPTDPVSPAVTMAADSTASILAGNGESAGGNKIVGTGTAEGLGAGSLPSSAPATEAAPETNTAAPSETDTAAQ